MGSPLVIFAMSLAMLQIIRVSGAAVTVNGEPVSVKSTLHPVHMGVQVDQMEARSSFSPTTTNNASPVNLGGGGGNGGISIVNPASISRSGQVMYAQNRDSYAQAAQSAGYSNAGSSSSGTSAGSYAAPSQPGVAYGTPTQNPQGAMTYYYYHYPAAAQQYGGDSTGKF